MGTINAVRWLMGTPQVHIHYLTPDDLADQLGYGEVDFACHGCGLVVKLRYPWPTGDEVDGESATMKALRYAFVGAHKAHFWPQGAFECPWVGEGQWPIQSR